MQTFILTTILSFSSGTKDFTLEGSDDGTQWVDLHTGTLADPDSVAEVGISENTKYPIRIAKIIEA